MGLDTSHDAWHGPYSSFGAWRQEIAKLAGIPKLDDMEGFGGDISWESLPSDPLHKLLNHSDCDGEILWSDCGPIADRLEQLIDSAPSEYYRRKTQDFINGCRRAFDAKENIDFH